MTYRYISPWTDDRITELRQLWRDNWSGGKIAEKMGFTRNAIIGKLNRLGLHASRPTNKIIRITNKSRPHPVQRRKFKLVEPFAAQTATVVPPLRIGILDLKPNHCRFPLDEKGADSLALFCGHPTHPGESWCAGHCHIVFNAQGGK